jgi:hypothetical protein
MKYELLCWPVKGPFSRPGIFNMISRISELQPCAAFVLVWTQLGIKHNGTSSQDGPKNISIFWRKDGPLYIFHLIPHIINRVYIKRLCWSLSKFHTVLQWAMFFKHMRIINGGAVFFQLDYSNSIKQSYRQNHFILKNVLMSNADYILFITYTAAF